MLALTETWPDGTERLLFIPIEVMGRKAEAVTALAPGTAVVVDGRLMRRKVGDRWETIVGCWDLTPITVPVTPVEVT
jgi:hypothetical protein